MMEILSISLIGHRELVNQRETDEKLYNYIKELFTSNEYVEVYVGRNGDFDILAASVVKRVQKALGKNNSCLTLVLPYSNKDIEYYEKYYDRIIIPESLVFSHPKGAIYRRNQWIIDESDVLICYVNKEGGGAYKAFKYAERKGKKIINIALDK